jgi:hypothetical protein
MQTHRQELNVFKSRGWEVQATGTFYPIIFLNNFRSKILLPLNQNVEVFRRVEAPFVLV